MQLWFSTSPSRTIQAPLRRLALSAEDLNRKAKLLYPLAEPLNINCIAVAPTGEIVAPSKPYNRAYKLTLGGCIGEVGGEEDYEYKRIVGRIKVTAKLEAHRLE
ncbi:MAG: hypothetical protein JWL59_633 [Chthoniobacteraceae bacterium]|nr:hypothetical protein [Chthoniobacteraceae bacterium]